MSRQRPLNVDLADVEQLVEKHGARGAAEIIWAKKESYDYGVIAGDLLLKSYGFSTDLREYLRKADPLLNDDVKKFLSENIDALQVVANELAPLVRKNNYTSVKLLCASYLMRLSKDSPPFEHPMFMHLRVAAQLYGGPTPVDLANTISVWRDYADQFYVAASPVLFNAGTPEPSMFSCNSYGVEDMLLSTPQLTTVEKQHYRIKEQPPGFSITDCWSMSALISKNKGASGIDVSRIRHSAIGLVGESGGIIPLMETFNAVIPYANQTGLRKGSATFFLQVHNIDLMDFCTLKVDGGSGVKCHHLNFCVWTNWLFEHRVRTGGNWTLFDAKTTPLLNELYGAEYVKQYEAYEADPKLQKKVLKARDIAKHIADCQIGSGQPYLMNRDSSNFKSNHKHLGFIRGSNLCVAGSTTILTKDLGHVAIETLEGRTVQIWNGTAWSEVKVVRTSKNQSMSRYTFEVHIITTTSERITTKQIICTDDHKFLTGSLNGDIKSCHRVEARDLKPGDKLKPFKLPFQEKVEYRVVVKDIEKNVVVADTFCVSEPENNAAVFNGILTGQCLEILEYYAPGEVACCNLGHMNLRKYVVDGRVDYDMLSVKMQQQVRNLNRVLDRNYYVHQAMYTTSARDRPLGIGVSGLAEMCYKLDDCFDSPSFAQTNRQVTACMYFNGLAASVDLAVKDGEHPSFPGSPFSQGKLQFDLWADELDELKRLGLAHPKSDNDDAPVDPQLWGQKAITLSNGHVIEPTWPSLKAAIQQFGTRNSMIMAYMPTVSMSQINRNTESFELPHQHMFSQRRLDGVVFRMNRFLERDLRALNLWTPELVEWIFENGGSVKGLANFIGSRQHAKRLLYLEKKYKTMLEESNRVMLGLAAARARYIDQSQSMNVAFMAPENSKMIAVHDLAEQHRLKTTQYYLIQGSVKVGLNLSTGTVKKAEPELVTAPAEDVQCRDGLCCV
jgi:ribonucleotide reductase alpha subunit